MTAERHRIVARLFREMAQIFAEASTFDQVAECVASAKWHDAAADRIDEIR
jgi:hypothetical protein